MKKGLLVCADSPLRGDSSFAGRYKRIQPFLRDSQHAAHDCCEVPNLWRRIEGWFLHASPEPAFSAPPARSYLRLRFAGQFIVSQPATRQPTLSRKVENLSAQAIRAVDLLHRSAP